MTGSAAASGRPDPSDVLDAMSAAPHHHEVLLENEQVRVLDSRVAPGGRTPVHTHRWPGVLYVLSWSDFVRYDADGRVLLDSRTLAATPEPGATRWSAPLGPHFVENVGGRELRVISVELKAAAAGPGMGPLAAALSTEGLRG